jgi:hypothetical protein
MKITNYLFLIIIATFFACNQSNNSIIEVDSDNYEEDSSEFKAVPQADVPAKFITLPDFLKFEYIPGTNLEKWCDGFDKDGNQTFLAEEFYKCKCFIARTKRTSSSDGDKTVNSVDIVDEIKYAEFDKVSDSVWTKTEFDFVGKEITSYDLFRTSKTTILNDTIIRLTKDSCF